MPECRIPLAEATIYLSTAPKSRSAYDALEEATSDVRQEGNLPIPVHLLNQPNASNYLEENKETSNKESQEEKLQAPENLPAKLQGRVYYIPSKEGYENDISSQSIHEKGRKSSNKSQRDNGSK